MKTQSVSRHLLFILLLFCVYSYTLALTNTTNVEGSGVEIADTVLESNFDEYMENDNSTDSNADYGSLLETSSNETCLDSHLSWSQRELILTTVNGLRSKLAFGKQPAGENETLPSGRNIYKLTWDCELEHKVADYSAQCPMGFMPQSLLHSDSHLYKVFFLWGKVNHTQNIAQALEAWWGQGTKKPIGDKKNRYNSTKNFYHWANMAKGKATRLGCSYKICSEKKQAIFSCLFSSKAQIEKEIIYESGRPCKVDDDCSTYPGSMCLPEEGLCLAPHWQRDKRSNWLCRENDQGIMTDAIRRAALEQHNFYRSRLSRGLEYNGATNQTQPRAKRMLKMEYDCELERYAQEWADNCKFAHSKNEERPNQGQNLYMMTFLNPDPRALLHTAVEKWWQELEEFGVPENNILSTDFWVQKGKLIGHYTQMAWDRSFRLGCGIADCPQMAYVVCHYGPAGNRKNHPIYEMGQSCQKHADCPFGFACLKNTALCADAFRKR